MTLVQPLAVFADVRTSSNAFAVNPDYLIGSTSNALLNYPMTLELGDYDYSVMPLSSIGSVTNTVGTAYLQVFYNQLSGGYRAVTYYPTWNGDSWHYSVTNLPSGCRDIYYISLVIPKNGLPVPGYYNLGFDISSDFSYSYNFFNIFATKNTNNASSVSESFVLSNVQTSSGDAYLAPMPIKLANVNSVTINCFVDAGLTAIGGDFRIQFIPTNSSSGAIDIGIDTSTQDYQSDVSGSLSDISSSIGDMSESLDSAAENLEYISTSQNLIIQGIDNVIMHISDQLYAFWDQLYNLIHEPTYARLGDILDAIRNLDLEITVEMTEVTNAVNKMNQEVQNKLQQTTDKITGGFDNFGINQDAAALDSSLQEYEQAEKNVLDNVNDSLNDFEFDSGLDEYKTSVQVFSDFLQALYESSGAFKIVINLSLMLSVAGIVIGLYRFKDGG